MSDRHILKRILRYNRGRLSEAVAIKYEKMAKDPFSFFRGSCHIFYDDWPLCSPLNEAPSIFICGDLHLENFGCYQGGDGVVRFGINDFDEAVMAPFTWDVARLLTSIFLAVQALGMEEQSGDELSRQFLGAYSKAALSQATEGSTDSHASGWAKSLLDKTAGRKRKDLLLRRTEMHKGKRRLLADSRTAKASPADYTAVAALLGGFAADKDSKKIFDVIDIRRRIAGTSSLGLERYIVLVSQTQEGGHDYLLDLKQARASALNPSLPLRQPHWSNEATRIVTLQKVIQDNAPAFLNAVAGQAKSYVLRELQPSEDRLDLKSMSSNMSLWQETVGCLALSTACAHWRSCLKLGAESCRQFAAYLKDRSFEKNILSYARTYASQVADDFLEFINAQGRSER